MAVVEKYFVDTHVLLWRLLEPKRLSKKLSAIFLQPQSMFLVPTIVLLEIQYLKEIGRVDLEISSVWEIFQQEDVFKLVPFDESALRHSLTLTSTRDPFDRVILAQALAASLPLLTKDRWMKQTAPHLVIS